MIIFKTVRFRNFLAAGNAFTEIKLNEHPVSLIVGDNGSGKSTMLDAICFALFSRPFRNINKPQLLNSINKKNCVVELEFSIGTKEYKIVRGIKPALFEIYVDGVLLDQDAATKDYQEYLEENILRLNYKAFTQIVVLGTASFVPFMQLPAAARREIIEEILDIRIFSTMNVVLKDKQNELKGRLQQLDYDLKLAKQKTKLQESYIASLQNDRQERIQEIQTKSAEIQKEIDEAEAHRQTLLRSRESLDVISSDVTTARLELQRHDGELEKLRRERGILEKELAFYVKNRDCPVCKQTITEGFRTESVTTLQEQMDTLSKTVQAVEEQRPSLQQAITDAQTNERQRVLLDGEIQKFDRTITSKGAVLSSLQQEEQKERAKISNLDAERNTLREMALAVVTLSKERSALNEEQHYYDIAGSLLKDSGVKTKIIKKYLDTINKMINKHLQGMDFFVQFELDEEFNEVIRSRHRDEFSYESFSQGEKQRIDMAILFTWRTIAKMKNSTATNLLILDEVFDSSLDNSATEYLINLLNGLGDQTNVWVISHRGDQLQDKIANTIRFVKTQNYSVME